MRSSFTCGALGFSVSFGSAAQVGPTTRAAISEHRNDGWVGFFGERGKMWEVDSVVD